MESNVNPFVKLKIYVVNDISELVMRGMDKIIVVFNKFEITNYSQFVEKLNEIYGDYGIVDKISDKDGFRIMNLNNLQINNIWNYLTNNEIAYITLKNKNDSLSPNKNKNKININFKNNYEQNNIITSYNKNNNNKLNNQNNLNKKNNKNNQKSKSSSSSSSFSKKKVNKKTLVILESSSSSSSKEKNISNSNSNSSKKRIDLDLFEENEISLNKSDKLKNNKKEDLYKEKKKNKYEKFNALGNKRKRNYKNFNDNFGFNKKKKLENINNKKNNNQNINIKNKKINYKLIPSDKLDDLTFLQKTYPKLFIQGTNIKFKTQELLENGIGVGNYHKGVVDDFNPENKSFLIKICDDNSFNEKTKILMYQYDDDLMFVELKNFVEIWIEKDNNDNEDDIIENSLAFEIDRNNDLTKNFIRRQVEYYFSDNNYEKDSYLKSKEDENGFIPISVIMGFNKIKMITNDKDIFISALKENEKDENSENGSVNKLYELNDDFTKIRKIKALYS